MDHARAHCVCGCFVDTGCILAGPRERPSKARFRRL
jgi:hypothetical protein